MTEVEPGLVRVGQLVEISMFFRVITFKNKSPAFKSHLQSILILSRERAEVRRRADARPCANLFPARFLPKRATVPLKKIGKHSDRMP